MANQKITQLNSITWSSVDANNDVIPIVDVNDTSMAPSGTTKKISAGQLISSLVPQTRTLTINGTTFDLTANRSWTIPTVLTVGTTAINSGTVGRILFEGAGNVLQEDSALFWDNTNKRLGVGATPSTSVRLDVRAQGALSTDIAFRVRNSADTQNLMSIAGNGDIIVGLNAIAGVAPLYSSGIIAIGNEAKGNGGGISIGNQAGKNQDNTDRFNTYIGTFVASQGTNSNGEKNVAIGYCSLLKVTTGAKNVSIGGGLSFDAPGANLTTGFENTLVGHSSGFSITTAYQNTYIGTFSGLNNQTGAKNTMIGYRNLHGKTTGGSFTNKVSNVCIGNNLFTAHNGVIMLGSGADIFAEADSIADDVAQFHFRSANQSLFFNKNTNVVLRSNSALTSGTHFEAAATNTITIHNGTAPVANITDAYAQYSADIVAGNAVPHFRTENGDVVKLYRVGGWGLPTGTFTRTTFDTATVTTAELAERVAALIQDLRDNHGLLKA